MPSRDIPPGPTGQRVAENVAALRTDRGYTKTELGRLLAGLGRPMTLDVLAKLEGQQRRVDPDDLVALALALRVTPNRLLLPGKAEDTEVQLTPARAASGRDVWTWASGEKLLAPNDGPFVVEHHSRFLSENRPHRGRGFTMNQEDEHEHVLRPIREALQQASDAGVPPTALVDCVESFNRLQSLTATVRAHIAALQHQDTEEDDDGQR
ncbi:MAG: helix-turn-helix transcriptional regulator [Pseudonocardiales bacterium]|nr:helix-turn-helix transcriptional regulator [Pseudonocardiales bacterium]MBV9031990.1 helix-turn-helix transcriptional regulator [Pseudonocardiales bacterium]